MNIKDKNIVHDTYALEELKEFFDIVEEKGNGCFCIKNSEDHDSIWKYFAILVFSSSNCDGSNVKYECFWYGEGPSGILRECRHSYFGSSYSENDGYVFLINRKIMNDAFDFLSKYYDLD